MQRNKLIQRIKTLSHPIKPRQFNHATKLRALSDIQCVAFDFYGTMFISGVGDIGVDEEQKSAYNRIFAEALQHSGFAADQTFPSHTGLQKFQNVIERRVQQKKDNGIDYPEPDIISVWQEVLAALLQLNLIEGPVTKEQAINFAVEFEFRANTIWPVPHLESVLKKLLHRNLLLGIISNSQFYTPLAFEALMGTSTDDFGFAPDLQHWSYVHGVKKPSLEFYRQFTTQVQNRGFTPQAVLYVGNDLFKDIVPAKKLGMKTALYVGDERSLRHKKADLGTEPHQPDIIIDELSQLLQCIT